MYHPLTSHSEHDASAAGHAQAAAHAAAVWPSRLRPQDVAWAHHPWSAQPPAPQLSQRACAYWPALHTYDGMDTSSHRTQYWPEHRTAADDAAYVVQCPSPYVIPAVSHSGFTDSWVHTDAGDVPNRSVAPASTRRQTDCVCLACVYSLCCRRVPPPRDGRAIRHTADGGAVGEPHTAPGSGLVSWNAAPPGFTGMDQRSRHVGWRQPADSARNQQLLDPMASPRVPRPAPHGHTRLSEAQVPAYDAVLLYPLPTGCAVGSIRSRMVRVADDAGISSMWETTSFTASHASTRMHPPRHRRRASRPYHVRCRLPGCERHAGFRDKHALGCHIRCVHRETLGLQPYPHKCSWRGCTHSYKQMSNLHRHMRTDHAARM